MAKARRLDATRIEIDLDPKEIKVLDFFTAEHQTTTEAMLAKMVSHWAAENLSVVLRNLHEEALAEVRAGGALSPTLRESLDAFDRLGVSEDHGHLIEKTLVTP
mgnify:CR=1 FL=1